MTRIHKTVIAASVLASVAMAAMNRAGAQVMTPRPEELRFQMVLNEPIAAPQRGGGVVAGTSAVLVKDRLTGQCFVAVTIGNAMGLSPATCQP